MQGRNERENYVYPWSPQPGPQTEAIIASWCTELFYGGARGGGKSDFLLGDYLKDVPTYGPHWQGILFRRTYPELQELVGRSKRLFPQTGAIWREADREWLWPNGAKLRMRYIERHDDVSRYQGHQYPWIGFDELTNWSDPSVYHEMKACLRWGETAIPTKRIRASGNPGGAGHGWVQQYFVNHAPLGFVPKLDEETGHKIMFIPARVYDNKILLDNDPGYINRLKGVGSPELVRAWLEGDWNAVVGAYFPEFGTSHLLDRIEIPKHWTRFRAFDWGSARPFCCLWIAVSEGGDKYPANSLIVYREWYGASAPNVGLKMHAGEVARGILKRDNNDEFAYSVADPAIFIEDGGPSIAESMNLAGVRFRAADNKRIPGWQQIRNRLIGEGGRPKLYIIAQNCPNLVRTLSTLQHDDAKPEDVDTESEDHAADALRYGCMTRAFSNPIPEAPKMRGINEMTMNELWEWHDNKPDLRNRI